MITDQLIRWLVTPFSWIVSNLPAIPVPSWLTGLGTNISNFAGDFAWFQDWIPLALVPLIIAAWSFSYGGAVTIKLVRMALSFISGGGGSVA